MTNFELQNDEVVLYEGEINSTTYKGLIILTLTSQKVVFEKEKGIFKKEREIVDVISLNDIKFYNDAAQIKQKGSEVEIQTTKGNTTLIFDNLFEARKFAGKIVDAVTGTTITKRGSEKIKSAFNMVDDTLGVDSRAALKGVLENGVKGTILNGLKKKK